MDAVPQIIMLLFKRIKKKHRRITQCSTTKNMAHNFLIYKYEKDYRDRVVMGIVREKTMSK